MDYSNNDTFHFHYRINQRGITKGMVMMVLYYGRVQQDRYILNTRDVQSLLNAHQRKPERQPLTKRRNSVVEKNFGQRWFGGGGNGKSVHYRLQFQQQRLVAF